MRSRKISSILFYNVCFLVFCNFPSTSGIFRLDDLKINQYYLGSTHVYTSKDKDSKVNKRETDKNEFIFPMKLRLQDEMFQALIRKRKSDVVHENTKIVHILDDKSLNENTTQYQLQNSHLYEGYIIRNPHNSSLNGYIKDNCFYGHVIVNNSVYYVDEINPHKDDLKLRSSGDSKENAIIYRGNSIIFTDLNQIIPVFRDTSGITPKEFRGMFQSWKEKGMLCPLIIVIDYSFLTLIHRGNKEAATTHILFSLEEVNTIFRSTDFDGDGEPDNIGFYVKKIVVLENDVNLYYITKYSTKMIDVNDFIQKFKFYKELQRHCLGIIFTAQVFTLKTLGASFSADHKNFLQVGGICDAQIEGRSFNALVITAVTLKFNPVPQIIFEITIAHELGHSFGSSHDNDQDARCFGYLMASKTFDDYDKIVSRMLFSNCSKETILRTFVVKGSCFEPVTSSFCGNGIIESDEQCDCGLIRECLEKDPCCVPRRTKERPCRINKKEGFECHPSQGQCCTKECRYSTSLNDYVDCKHFERTCPCSKFQTKCSCGINGMCIGRKCHSVECTRLGLNECHCQQETQKNSCSICCEYKDQCVSVLEATAEVVNEEKRIHTLSANTEISKFKGKNSIFKKFCIRNATMRQATQDCVNLHFFRAKRYDYCLLNGQLGQCSQTYDCMVFPNKQVFPSLPNKRMRNSTNCVRQIVTFLNVVIFYLLHFGFKNIFF